MIPNRPDDMREDVKAFWPRSFFTEEKGGDSTDKDTWWLGSRERNGHKTYVGLFCNHKTSTEVCKGKHFHVEYDDEARPSEKNVVCISIKPLYYMATNFFRYQYRVSNGNKCVWICVLGDSSTYRSLGAFKEYVRSYELTTTKNEAAYSGILSKNGEVILTATVEAGIV